MFRYKLRTLLIVLALGPPVLAGGWFVFARCTVYVSNWSIIIRPPPEIPRDFPATGITGPHVYPGRSTKSVTKAP